MRSKSPLSIFPALEYSNAESILAMLRFNQLLVNLESMNAKPFCKWGQQKKCNMENETAVCYFV